MGDASTTQQINTGVTTAGALVGSAAAGGLLTTVGIAASAVPLIGAAVLAATTLIQAFHIGQGCGSSCTQSTQVVNQVIPLMQQNLAAAQAQLEENGGCLTPDEQAALVGNFDKLWNAIVQGCTQVGGPGGANCISDRQRGGKYDCFVTLRDPISAMQVCYPVAAEDTSTTGGAVDSAVDDLAGATVAGIPLLPIAAVALIAFGLMGGK
jgi:hypothetical protein